MRSLQSNLLAPAIQGGDRTALARAITLVESQLTSDRRDTEILFEQLLPVKGDSVRIGVTGVPGAGKSTLIEQLGIQALGMGYKVAVLTVDPSSQQSGGSILADKTRMTRLAGHPQAFVRPSPAGNARGGVATRTRECIYLCEAAGFDLVFVETVGVGQVELAVAGITDIVLLMLLPGGGDELQKMKSGVIESADFLLINKADREMRDVALSTASDYQQVFRLIRRPRGNDIVDVLAISALENQGLRDVLQKVIHLYQKRCESGELSSRREDQTKAWLWQSIKETLEESILGDLSDVGTGTMARLEKDVVDGRMTASVAARHFIDHCLEYRFGENR